MTDRNLPQDMTDAERRLANLVVLGQVAELDAERARVRVKAGPILTAWLPFTTGRAGPDVTWHAPEPGEQVVLVAPGGDLNQAVILGAYYRDAHPAPADSPDIRRTVFKDGTIEEYDRQNHHWLLDLRANNGTVEILTGTTQVRIGPGNLWLRADRIDLNDDR